jgi:DNA-binding LacI/PurR family transcriptional regulator
MNQKITIKKIAEHCGVSIATVSRAINGSSYVSAELQKKIREYIEDVGWHPSGLIRKLPDKMNTEIIVVGSLSLLEHAENSQGLKLLLENLYQAGFSPVLRLGHRAETLRQC